MTRRDLAKRLRTNQTEAERRLWYHLRGHRFMSLKFKRQVPMGQYVVDFLCHQHRLIVEVDGGHHTGQMGYDQERSDMLRQRGFRVLRFWNHEVMQQLDGVLEQIRLAVLEPSPPSPLPLAGEGNDPPSTSGLLPRAGEGRGLASLPNGVKD